LKALRNDFLQRNNFDKKRIKPEIKLFNKAVEYERQNKHLDEQFVTLLKDEIKSLGASANL
jgi:hypothetical protein